MSREYDTLNGSDIGSGLELLQGGVIVTTDANGLSIDRLVRGRIGQTEDTHSAEVLIYGTGALANKVSIGIATLDTPTNEYVGGDASSIGYRAGEGEIHTGGVSVATVATAQIGDYIGVLLVYGDDGAAVTFKRNRDVLGTVALTTDMLAAEIYLALSLGSTVAGDLSLFVKFGRHDFEHPEPLATGWWRPRALPDTVRIASEEFITDTTDDLPHQRYRGMLANESALLTRGVSFWTEGSTAGRTSELSLTINDAAGVLDHMVGGQWVDQPARLREVEAGSALSTAVDLGSFVIDDVVPISDGQKRIVLRDSQVLLDQPMQRRFFAPNADGQAANRPWPLIVGAAFSVPPVLFDESNRIYAIDSIGIAGIGKVRDRGVPILPAVSEGYVIVMGGQAIQLMQDPAGQLTTDASVTGDAIEITGLPDAIGGDGAPFAGVDGGAITSWDRFEQTFGGVLLPEFESAGARVRFRSEYLATQYIQHQTAQFEAGKAYRVVVDVVTITGYDATTGATPYLAFTNSANHLAAVASFQAGAGEMAGSGTWAFTYAPETTHDVMLYYVDRTAPGWAADALIGSVIIYELPDPSDSDADDDLLQPLTLEQMLRHIIEVRGRLPASFWNSADAAAIDAATGYRGSGFATAVETPLREAIDRVLIGYGAARFTDRSGVMRIARLIAPEDVGASDVAGTLHKRQMLSDMIPRPDRAPGLTRAIGARHNWHVLSDTDLDTSDVDVGMALRRRLSRDDRYIVSTGGTLAPGCEHADSGQPLQSLLNDSDDARTEIERVRLIHAPERCYYDVRIPIDVTMEIDQVWIVHYEDEQTGETRYGFDGGVQLHVRYIAEDLVNRETQVVTFWGLAPAELLRRLEEES